LNETRDVGKKPTVAIVSVSDHVPGDVDVPSRRNQVRHDYVARVDVCDCQRVEIHVDRRRVGKQSIVNLEIVCDVEVVCDVDVVRRD
jgi:alpha-D-ribose 1-methylphosphonate 5-triphosphate diphosphatase PhnM